MREHGFVTESLFFMLFAMKSMILRMYIVQLPTVIKIPTMLSCSVHLWALNKTMIKSTTAQKHYDVNVASC